MGLSRELCITTMFLHAEDCHFLSFSYLLLTQMFTNVHKFGYFLYILWLIAQKIELCQQLFYQHYQYCINKTKYKLNGPCFLWTSITNALCTEFTSLKWTWLISSTTAAHIISKANCHLHLTSSEVDTSVVPSQAGLSMATYTLLRLSPGTGTKVIEVMTS